MWEIWIVLLMVLVGTILFYFWITNSIKYDLNHKSYSQKNNILN
jgi:hypothetical protein